MTDNVTKSTSLAELTTKANEVGRPLPPLEISMFTDAGFNLTQRMAVCLSKSTIVPKAYQDNVSNCVIALNIAKRIDTDPFMVMQNLYVINGSPAWSSKFLIATFNKNPKFTSLRFKFEGTRGENDFGCRCVSFDKETKSELIGSLVDVQMAHDQGWWTRMGSKWPAMTEQMLMYRAASFFIKVYAPEISLGMDTMEEAVETIYGLDGIFRVSTDEIKPTFEPKPEVKAKVDIKSVLPVPAAKPTAPKLFDKKEPEPVADKFSAKTLVIEHLAMINVTAGAAVSKFTPNKSIHDYNDNDWLELGKHLKVPEIMNN
jgi:hypothetical protein